MGNTRHIISVRSMLWATLITFFTAGTSLVTQAQIQPYLKAVDPFVYDGIATRALIGPRESTLSVAGASIVQGWYGEVGIDIDGLLGNEMDISASTPSFLLKYAPLKLPITPEVHSIWTLSIGTKALTALEAFAGTGIYVDDGRFAIGGGLKVTWDKLKDDRLSGPTYAWAIRGYTKLHRAVSVDMATTLSQNTDERRTDAAVIYQPFHHPFQVYVEFMDVFSGHAERRLGLSYAVEF
jgi:hypothetical protein